MKGNSQVNAVVYRWDVTRSISKNFNLGLEEGEQKSHFYKHKISFKHKGHSNKTKLSSYMWQKSFK